MTLAILHLSDIHIKTAGDLIISRVGAIAAAFCAASRAADSRVLVISGDIAYSGLADQYSAAADLVTTLRSQIQAEFSDSSLSVVLVPGNHDLDFGPSSQARDMLIPLMSNQLPALDPDGTAVTTCLGPQEAYFNFANATDHLVRARPSHCLYHESLVTQGAARVRFQCYNSAWLSQLPEKNTLVFPVSVASSAEQSSQACDLAVTVVHHPYSWFTPDNGRALRDFVERTSDVVLTGHEHVSSAFTKDASTQVIRYVEGAVLQDTNDPNASGFNVVLVDLHMHSFEVSEYRWVGSNYEPIRAPVRSPFVRNPILTENQFVVTARFREHLEDPGAAFTHPRKERLTLHDTFVYPDLRRMDPADVVTNGRVHRIQGDELPDYLAGRPLVVISGGLNAGKTTLAKVLFTALLERGSVPLLLAGRELRTATEAGFLTVCKNTFSDQYGSAGWTRFDQLKRAQRALLIDDFHDTRLGRKGYAALLALAERFAGTVVLFVDDLFGLEEIAHLADVAGDPLGQYDKLKILEFGYRLRGVLIEKWYRTGYELDPPEGLDFDISTAERLLSALISKDLLPSDPITALTILQVQEASKVPTSSHGSYGHLYEALITATLSKVSTKLSDVDTLYTLIAHIAFAVFASGTDALEDSELERVLDHYETGYRLKIGRDELLRSLETAQILDRTAGGWRFRYPHVYCYFTARYLHHEAATKPAQDGIARIVNTIYADTSAHILMFYLYLSRDASTIDSVLAVARRIYGNYGVSDLAEDVEFVNRLQSEYRPLVLPLGTVDERRDDARRRLDEGEDGDTPLGPKANNYDDALDDIIKVHYALKTLHVLGQVLRNFPGSLKADTKLDIAAECYRLGLRTLRALLTIAEANQEAFRAVLAELVKDRRRIGTAAELVARVDTALVGLTLTCGIGLVKRVSSAVGMEELSGTYEDVARLIPDNLAVEMIDLSIRLDHFRDGASSKRLQAAADSTRKNFFAHSVLRELVAHYLYVVDVGHKRRQQLGELFDIKTSEPKFIGNSDRRRR